MRGGARRMRVRAPDRPATYRQVLASGEFRVIFLAGTMSWVGDYLARAALVFLVYQHTRGSPLWAAATFAVGYLPEILLGPMLAAVGERYSARRVMVLCDLGRMTAIGLMVVPGLPVWTLLALLFVAAVGAPPFGAARSALLPVLLTGDRYVVGTSLSGTVNQLAQLGGYALGGVVATVDPRLALAIDAATFAASALAVRLGVRARPPGTASPHRAVFRDTAAGLLLVWRQPELRRIVCALALGTLSAIAPEALAPGWADELGAGALGQSLIMAAAPLGLAVSTVLVGRLLGPRRRQALLRPTAVLLPAVLITALAHPPLPVVVGLAGLAALLLGTLVAPASARFVELVPADHRMRAFAVLGAALQLGQLAGSVGIAAIADRSGDVAGTIGWCAAGAATLGAVVAVSWPRRSR